MPYKFDEDRFVKVRSTNETGQILKVLDDGRKYLLHYPLNNHTYDEDELIGGAKAENLREPPRLNSYFPHSQRQYGGRKSRRNRRRRQNKNKSRRRYTRRR